MIALQPDIYFSGKTSSHHTDTVLVAELCRIFRTGIGRHKPRAIDSSVHVTDAYLTDSSATTATTAAAAKNNNKNNKNYDYDDAHFKDDLTFDRLLWCDSSQDDYLKHKIKEQYSGSGSGEDDGDEEETKLPAALEPAAMDDDDYDYDYDYDSSIYDSSIIREEKKQEEERSSSSSSSSKKKKNIIGNSLEMILRFGGGLLGTNNSDNFTIDEIIEETEREEEESAKSLSSSSSFPKTTSAKNIRKNLANANNNKFVNDETSVGSITEEIGVIVKNNISQSQQQLDIEEGGGNEDDDEQGTISNTMISSLSNDDDTNSYIVRAQQLLGIQQSVSSARQQHQKKDINSSRSSNSSSSKDNEKQPWKDVDEEEVTSSPVTPPRSYDISKDGKPTKMKTKDTPNTPGTPSTVIIKMGHPLGLATPPPSDTDGDHGYQYNKNKKYSDDDNDDGDGWYCSSFGFLIRAGNNNKVYRRSIVLVGVLLALFLILIVVASVQLTGWNSNPITIGESSSEFDLSGWEDRPTVWTIVGSDAAATGPPSVATADQTIVDSGAAATGPPSVAATENQTFDPSAALLPDNGTPVENLDEILMQVINERLPETVTALVNDPSSPQYRAYEWTVKTSPLTKQELEINPMRLIQRYVLAVLYYMTNGNLWTNSTGWLDTHDECAWFSTSGNDEVCDPLGRMYEIDLRRNNLSGPIPSEFVLLSSTVHTFVEW
ncbi:hypothetical protein FRACYDRAFT_246980 [Fragilariopsis cylindrus CCMP1102]|uniref:Uncharacterized protein n=1 Tax=Fragilariopsis cylindrus CCMP1102 TaxID=635003 RepID=A0A1E7EXF5_9STRA|nr:hypothetical protein FRACYDRAFT_246980 [Fragilariopsis cylindrus CCMP1102]|eukprot:OEU10494.1 hypothetical protein FRACYDRAFT_246980 [Fragilariopsis cylindrus CCMP1102]